MLSSGERVPSLGPVAAAESCPKQASAATRGSGGVLGSQLGRGPAAGYVGCGHSPRGRAGCAFHWGRACGGLFLLEPARWLRLSQSGCQAPSVGPR